MSDASHSLIPPKLVSPGANDERQQAYAQIFGEALAEIDIPALIMNDVMSVDARLLPYLIREFSAQEFIDPDLPEHVQRRILKNIWELKSLHGYDAGVKLGLELLGMSASIVQWHQMEPMGAPNTHRVEIFLRDVLFPDDDGYFGPRQLRATQRMIDATKRWSQGTTLRFGMRTTSTRFVGAVASSSLSVRGRIRHRTSSTPIAPATRAMQATTRTVAMGTYRDIRAGAAKIERRRAITAITRTTVIARPA